MKSLVIVLGLLSSMSAFADICAYAPDMNLKAVNKALRGKLVTEEGVTDLRQARTGNVIAVGRDSSNGIYMEIRLLASGKVGRRPITIPQADLGHMLLVCKSHGEVKLVNLGGAMLKSGVACASKDFIHNVPESDLDLDCK